MRAIRLSFATAALLVAGLASCSSDDSISVRFVAQTGEVAEDGTSIDLEVELLLPKDEDPLEEEVSVEVSQTGGTAEPADFVTFDDTTLVFPVGSEDGDTLTVSVTSVSDGLFEGDETVILTLRNAMGAKLGGAKTATITILDDEQPASLAVTIDTGAGEEDAPTGSSVNFGSQSSGSTGDAVFLTLRNEGNTPLEFEAPLTVGGDEVDFSVRANPDLQTSAFPVASDALRGALKLTDADPELGWELTLAPSLLEQLASKDRVRLEDVPLPQLGEATMELRRVRSPWADDAILYLDGEVVPGGPQSVLGEISLWKGELVGWASSSIYLAFSEAGTRGWIRPDAVDGRMIHVLSQDRAGHTLRMTWGEQLAAHGYSERSLGCGGALLPPQSTELAPDPAPATLDGAPPRAKKSISPSCRVLFETDHQFFQLFGDEEAATTYVTQLVGAVSDLYEEQVQTEVEIASLALYTTANDPWTAPDGPTSINALLTEFADARSPLPNDIDLGHFLSAAEYPDAAGLAFLDTLCNENFGFSVSGYIDGTFDSGNFDGTPAVVNFDFNTSAHELGHNFGAAHTDEFCPPLDRCVATCVGGAVCASGTIMSNCNICPGGELSIIPEFHPFIANEMRTAVNLSCIGRSRLNPGETIVLSLQFAPSAESGTGQKSTSLRIEHAAGNETSPYALTLRGTAD